MNRKTLFIASTAVLLLAFGAGALIYKSDKMQRWSQAGGRSEPALARDYSPTLGKADAKVHIVEFLDPACETCARFYPHVKRLMAANPDRIRLSIRHVPFHHGADYVVKILEAARQQGKYWQALEAVLASQADWTSNHRVQPESVWKALGGLALNLEQIKADMNAPEIARRIEQDLTDAKTLNVTRTPGFFVNGRPLPSFGLEQLQNLVKEALHSAYR